MSLEDNIKKWVSLDNKIKEQNEKLKQLRLEKNDFENNITEYIENNDLMHATIEISDGKLKYNNFKNTQPLTLKYVEKCLKEIIKNESQVTVIMDYIKQNREEKITPIIKRFYN